MSLNSEALRLFLGVVDAGSLSAAAFGAVQGDFDTLSALATLAYDCRRPEKFRPQLLDALRELKVSDLLVQTLSTIGSLPSAALTIVASGCRRISSSARGRSPTAKCGGW